MEVTITKRRITINWFMFILAMGIIINAIVQVMLLIIFSAQTKFVIGFAFSFIGLFVYGFNFLFEGKRVLYYKKYKAKIEIGNQLSEETEQELSSVFITEEGRLLK